MKEPDHVLLRMSYQGEEPVVCEEQSGGYLSSQVMPVRELIINILGREGRIATRISFKVASQYSELRLHLINN